jgi:signal transduction histidine kinase
VARREAFAQAPEERDMSHVSLTGCDREGHEFPIHLALRPLAEGATLVIVEDLRETSHQALARLARSSRETLATTFGAVAHELNNPLGCILPSLELAVDICGQHDHQLPLPSPVAAQLMAALEDCLEGARRIRGIVVDMATLGGARHEEGGARLVAIAEATARLIDTRAPQGLRVRAQASGDPRVACAAAHAGQILLNLGLNALHAMIEAKRGGEIVFEVSTGAGEVGVVDIRDQGPGVPTELRERIFAPFFTTRAAGSGIGLALSREKARLLEGNLMLAHSDEDGSVFRLTLPLDVSARGLSPR